LTYSLFCFMVRLRESRAILLLSAGFGVVFALTYPPAVLLPLGLLVFTLYFFRDPQRSIPHDAAAVICPADGTVMDVEEMDDPFVGRARRLSIFMSPFNVHVNRSPIAGVVASITHTPGLKVAAYLKGDLTARERNRIEVLGSLKIAVEQYAGVVARRIVCWASQGQRLEAGERIGMIKFGSRVDVIAPLNVRFVVSKGQAVRAGETVVGVING
jgi:phosphatidylserine decarboxylase